MTEWDIRSWCWWPGLPVGQHYKVVLSVHCHTSGPLMIWPYMFPGRKTPTTNQQSDQHGAQMIKQGKTKVFCCPWTYVFVYHRDGMPCLNCLSYIMHYTIVWTHPSEAQSIACITDVQMTLTRRTIHLLGSPALTRKGLLFCLLEKPPKLCQALLKFIILKYFLPKESHYIILRYCLVKKDKLFPFILFLFVNTVLQLHKTSVS